jgi:hypothetical protein
MKAPTASMTKAVIDTNVLLIANEQHGEVSPACVAACVHRLREMELTGVAVIDDGYRIVREYLNKTSPNRGKGPGDVFLKWLLRNTANSNRVHQVAITEPRSDEFVEFPDAALQTRFDIPDRKFVAVAHAHSDRPPIWQAADSKWLDWWSALAAYGVTVEFLCPADACRFYRSKFPDRPAPQLPAA